MPPSWIYLARIIVSLGQLAMSPSYFGFLWSVEFTVSTRAFFAASIHLGIQDIAVDSDSNPSCTHVRIKASKTFARSVLFTLAEEITLFVPFKLSGCT